MPTVTSVALKSEHAFSKTLVEAIDIVENFGVRGDAHAGVTVKHRSRVAVDPTQPNLRQVHLIQGELFAELESQGFSIRPGDLGENIVTEGIALLDLPRDTLLQIGPDAVLRVTGLRNPCPQIEAFRSGLLKALVYKDDQDRLVRKAGIMTVVLKSGTVRPGDPITIILPPLPHHPLERV
ncbi:molybdenum cofactor biosysynthesis protein [Xaviernesmea oryzae]|uniref:Molybdenum cofactor biosysynthesis protein n=1 Tax=Xaviernesmea oryzae TaxID=464029 RepID=A0A1Q9B2V4_9HYPH|nr:MOSC domain-containing protein [Xaviernesmea oryzae]OLP62355.1 molybdenum cofactor biosysynthesis protein [Xaviernesmea oryzae]SEL98005.1 MOSC domain-containing protein YiiM [Xaviernesmea oryzae]